MPVWQDLTIYLWPGLFKSLVYIVRQLALSQILAVLLDLAQHRHTNHNTINQRSIQSTRVKHSPEYKLTHSQAMLSCSGTDNRQLLKIGIMPVLLLVVAENAENPTNLSV